MSKGMSKPLCKITAKNNTTNVQGVEYVWYLLRAIRLIKRLDIKVKEDIPLTLSLAIMMKLISKSRQTLLYLLITMASV